MRWIKLNCSQESFQHLSGPTSQADTGLSHPGYQRACRELLDKGVACYAELRPFPGRSKVDLLLQAGGLMVESSTTARCSQNVPRWAKRTWRCPKSNCFRSTASPLGSQHLPSCLLAEGFNSPHPTLKNSIIQSKLGDVSSNKGHEMIGTCLVAFLHADDQWTLFLTVATHQAWPNIMLFP